MTDEASFGAFVRGVLDTHGRIDVLVNGVGGFAGAISSRPRSPSGTAS